MTTSQAGGALSTEDVVENTGGDDRTTDPVVRRFPYLYAYMITSCTFLFIFIAILGPAFLPKELPERSWRVVDTVLGFLLGVGLSAILQFFYGSSQGSRDKDEHITTLASQSRPGCLALSAGSQSERRMFAGTAPGDNAPAAIPLRSQRQTFAGAGQSEAVQPGTMQSDPVPSGAMQSDPVPSHLPQEEGGDDGGGDGSGPRS